MSQSRIQASRIDPLSLTWKRQRIRKVDTFRSKNRASRQIRREESTLELLQSQVIKLVEMLAKSMFRTRWSKATARTSCRWTNKQLLRTEYSTNSSIKLLSMNHLVNRQMYAQFRCPRNKCWRIVKVLYCKSTRLTFKIKWTQRRRRICSKSSSHFLQQHKAIRRKTVRWVSYRLFYDHLLTPFWFIQVPTELIQLHQRVEKAT